MQEKIQINSPLKQRILQFIDYLNISKRDFYSITGVSRGTFENSTGITEGTLAKVFANYPDLNKEWVLDGKGEMLIKNTNNVIDETKAIYIKKLPLISVDCIVESEITQQYVVPEFVSKGAEFLIRVSGDGMYPKYSNGDLLACRNIKDISFFQWGKVYVLNTDQGVLIKMVFPCNEDVECLECRSDNFEYYPPFRISKSSIRSVALVLGVIRLE